MSSLLQVSYRRVTIFNVVVPVFGLLVTLVIGLYLHYDILTDTHCKVPNFFTTISKLTGEELPERYIWRMCMSLVAMPLILDGVVLHRALSFEAGVLQRWWLRMLNTTVLLLHFMQMYLLLSVTYLSSKEHMDYHVDMWYTFFGTSLLHMFSLFLLLYLGKQRPFSNRDRKAMKFRLVCLAIHLTGVGAFIHFANRHWDCEPYGILLPILV
ncbi:hypothetical protein EMCRGX_G025621 [Ephydatia muelleri]